METSVLEDIHFDGFLDWFIRVYPIRTLWKNQPTYMIVQASIFLGGVSTFVHALYSGGRLPYLWAATILHGLVVECLCYISSDIDNFWHSQTPIIFLGRRLPLHILFIYPNFIYQASVAATQLKLPRWAEPFAVGLLVVLIDLPYDITSVKFVHWTWHDTDPNIADRHYWVPWNSYYFHLAFAASFSFWFHTVRYWMDAQTPKWQTSRLNIELLSLAIASILGPLGGIAMFQLLYQPLHDLFHIHSEVTFFVLLSLALLLVWTAERFSLNQSENKLVFQHILLGALAIHYAVFLALVCFGHPEREVSVGLHERVGPCNLTHPVQTLFGVLERSAFLCVEDYDEGYFDFHCVLDLPHSNASWYTICGTPFNNRPEYIAVISIITLNAFVIFWNIYFNSVKNSMDTKYKLVGKYKNQ